MALTGSEHLVCRFRTPGGIGQGALKHYSTHFRLNEDGSIIRMWPRRAPQSVSND